MTTNMNCGIYTFCAHGMMYHNVRSFGREAGAEHKHLELYFYDDDPSLEHRYRKCRQDQLDKDKAVIKQLVEILKGNPYSEHLRSMGHVDNIEDYHIALNLDQTLNQNLYNAPITSEVAAVWIKGSERRGQFSNSVMLHGKDRSSHGIRSYHACYDALSYPMFFPKGELGWHANIPKSSVSMDEVDAYLEQHRTRDANDDDTGADRSMLTAYFEANRLHEEARGILYRDFPEWYTLQQGKVWQRRKRNTGGQGRTAHSRFKIPLTIDDGDVCSFTKQSGTAKLLQKASLIIWDEASMTKRQAIEALDNSMCDIMGQPGLPFGWRTVVFGGDFRQVLPVVRKGSRAQIVAASLQSSYLWESMYHLKLVQNMRAQSDPWFAEYLLRVGGGTEVANNDGDVRLPDEVCVPYTGNDRDLDRLIDDIYPNLNENMSNTSYITSRAILSTRND
ncbi:hypothetical protein ZEAMMB73_Zm00001d039205 [Zea mays]|uniref:ATP-dependent DNA helicase n=1 Tax=Zea mays TaxID=4577 RepID=A0A1D6MEG5_MAIZE|nr:hypothetical protein ZEAMMB73_Zm00001d039205 [Zea mays]